MIGKKQQSTHEEFVAAWDRIEEIVPRADYDRLLGKAVDRIKALQAGRSMRLAYAWSGGKDSIALKAVCDAAGIEDCCYGMTQGLEYPAFLRWVTDNMPGRLAVYSNDWDLDWLADHQEMLFPANASIAGKWFAGIQHRAQRLYFTEHRIDVLLLGRRWADGNFTGRRGANGRKMFYIKDGIARFSPIADWTHEEVLASMHYEGFRDNLPPIYSWPRGYRCGTHAWAARQWCRDHDHGWSEIMEIDSSIVYEAAGRIVSARRFLDRFHSTTRRED